MKHLQSSSLGNELARKKKIKETASDKAKMQQPNVTVVTSGCSGETLFPLSPLRSKSRRQG